MKTAYKSVAILGVALSFAPAVRADDAAWSKPLDVERSRLHLLNRLAFGPRPGDLEQLRKTGGNAWLEAQLNPNSIDDSAVEGKVAAYTTAKLDGRQLMIAYQADTMKVLKPLLKAKGVKAGQEAMDAKVEKMDLTDREKALYETMRKENMDAGTSSQAVGELVAEKLMRGVESKRQLQEVLVDFWSNHFNIDIKKGPDRALKVIDERQVIRPRVFGNFRDLIEASATSPAMLWYLDNAKSTTVVKTRDGKTRGGLNENYAREIMELHTLGVDGGYTQADVQEVARCFTGWAFDRETATFRFRPFLHDNGEKTVLGVKIPANGGQSDGEKVLDVLAYHPSTAQHLAKQLCMRFVADNPPASLVKKVAATFTATKGDLKATYRTLFTAPEFWSEGAYHSKIKSPFEYCVSAVRALDGSYTDSSAGNPRDRLRLIAIGASAMRPAGKMRPLLSTEIATMGQPLFGCVPPTGYTENSADWVSSSALVTRLNFALNLTGGRLADVVLNQDTFRPASVDEVVGQLSMGPISAGTRKTLETETAANPDGARLRALLLGSPEFQRR